MELHMVLPAPDTDEKNGLNLLRRLWVVKFDKEEEIRKLAERWEPLEDFVFFFQFYPLSTYEKLAPECLANNKRRTRWLGLAGWVPQILF